ncbi:MAG: AAA family ATPase [Saprospiraceae bacterium]
MCDNLHSLTTNNLALARAKGKKERSYTWEIYLNKINFLIDKNIAVDKRIDRALKQDRYKIKFFGRSSITELIAYNEPEIYTFYNIKEQQAIQIFEIESNILNEINGKKTLGKEFKAFNKIVQSEILEDYVSVIYNQKLKKIEQKNLLSGTTLMLEIDQFISWAFKMNKDEKEMSKEKSKEIIERGTVVDNRFLENIVIKDFYTIKEIELKDLSNKRFIFLLGENGTGKSIFLKALLITLKKSYIDKVASKDTIAIISKILEDNSPNFEAWIVDNQGQDFNIKNDVRYLNNAYAYGTSRNKTEISDEKYLLDFSTLFDNNAYMTNIDAWLKSIKLKEYEAKDRGEKKYFKVKDITSILSDLLDLEDLKINVSSEKVTFIIHDEEKRFKELSQGFQSTMTLIVDLLKHLIKNNSDERKTINDNQPIKSLKDLKQTKAVVLIDELDLFLHPKWEKSICGKLHSKFPNIQFFVTTHSPILIDGAVKDDRVDNEKIKIFKLDVQNSETIIEGEYSGKVIEDWSLDLLTHSQIFDDNYLTEEQRADIRLESNEHELLELGSKLKIVFEKEAELQRKYSENLNQ